MPSTISPLIKPEELLLLQHSTQPLLVDARTGPAAKENYTALHLSGAQFVDLETEMSQKKDPANGGRHPLPGIQQFSSLLTRMGITPETHVVVYDDKNGANAASRFWWMLRSAGHTAVQVLDGGLAAALAAGVPTSSQQESVKTVAPYPVSEWKLPVARINEVEKEAQNPLSLVIDVREAERYRGEKEPIDLIAGHIPGAVNVPFSSNLDSKGYFLPPAELKEKYQGIIKDRKTEHVIVHCGSGVTACHTLLAMEYAGLGIPVLYVGSWSEWSRTERPIAREAPV